MDDHVAKAIVGKVACVGTILVHCAYFGNVLLPSF